MALRSRWLLAGIAAVLLAILFSILALVAEPRTEVEQGANGARTTLPPREAVVPSALVDPGRTAASPAEVEGRTALAGAIEPRSGARLTFHITYRSTPVTRATLWLTANGLQLGTTDELGVVSFEVPATRASFGFEDVGSVHSNGDFYFVPVQAPGKSAHVTVEDGVDQVIALALETAASVGGVALGVDGGPLADLKLLLVQAEGDGWGKPRPAVTDAGGRFVFERLGPGWTLIGPDPTRPVVFPFERFELARGEHREVELHELPRRRVTVELDLVGEAHGTPWTLPIRLRIARRESLAELVGTKHGMLFHHQPPPHQWTEELNPGAHIVRAASCHFSYGECSITASWERWVEFAVAPGVDELRVGVPVPDLGPLARVACALTHPPGTTHVAVSWNDRAGQPRQSSLNFDDELRCEVVVDLDEVPSRTVTIFAQEGSVRRTLATLALQPGESSVVLTPGE